MKKGLYLLSFLFLTLSISIQAQTRKLRRDELIFGIGGTGFMGELGGANKIGTYGPRDFDFKSVRPSFDFGYRYRMSDRWAIKTSGFWGLVYGNDKFTTELYRNNRNLSFRSNIIELSSQVDFFFMTNTVGQRYKLHVQGKKNVRFSGYVFAGVGGFYYNPQAKFTNNIDGSTKWYNLRGYHTEGEGIIPTRKEYSNFSFCIPFGIGIAYGWTKYWSIGLEYGFRKTFTDYIDDCSTTYVDPSIYGNTSDLHSYMSQEFSNPSPNKNQDNPLGIATQPGQQRGDPKKKDSYMFAMFNVYYKIHTNRKFYPIFPKKKKY